MPPFWCTIASLWCAGLLAAQPSSPVQAACVERPLGSTSNGRGQNATVPRPAAWGCTGCGAMRGCETLCAHNSLLPHPSPFLLLPQPTAMCRHFYSRTSPLLQNQPFTPEPALYSRTNPPCDTSAYSTAMPLQAEQNLAAFMACHGCSLPLVAS